eukprot:TRINITY_DN60722_c0_g1_i1.p1 TRINITY_DN60722_c0_g1~~TRINITY_DN60722_c0_g1_i1.p1  ORF type:complete len:365 (-),score=34.14 TRINITY_DN60722_c0_g1_i1:76-1170(-)
MRRPRGPGMLLVPLLLLCLPLCWAQDSREVGFSPGPSLRGKLPSPSHRPRHQFEGSRIFFPNGNAACPVGSEPLVDIIDCLAGADMTLDMRRVCHSLDLRDCIQSVDIANQPKGCYTFYDGISISLRLNPHGQALTCAPAAVCNVLCVKLPPGPVTTSTTSSVSTSTSRSTTRTISTATAASTSTYTTSSAPAEPGSAADAYTSTSKLVTTAAIWTAHNSTATQTFSSFANRSVSTTTTSTGHNNTLSLETTSSSSKSSVTPFTSTTHTDSSTITSFLASTTRVTTLTSTSSDEVLITTAIITSSTSADRVQGCGNVCVNLGFVPEDCRCYLTDNRYQWTCDSKERQPLRSPYYCDKFCTSCQP